MFSTSHTAAGRRTTDVIVIGDGIIGLSTALELERRGARCIVFGTQRRGIASFAAAGLLAPSIGQLPPGARPFFETSLRLYPALLASLAEFDDELALMTGLLLVADASTDGESANPGQRLSPDEACRLEPSIQAPHGAVVHTNDGAIDNVRLMHALQRAAEQRQALELIADAPVSSLHMARGGATVVSESGLEAVAPYAILAAGAWSPRIHGLPRPLPVFPLKGQMLALDVCPLSRPVVGNGVYLVPRGTETVVGSTSEHAGFDVSTTPQAIEALHQVAAGVCPELASSRQARAWAGIRPATPDMLPILGPDPDYPALVYATGHSRNGILLAPATAKVVADIAIGNRPTFDLSGFGFARFGQALEETNLNLEH